MGTKYQCKPRYYLVKAAVTSLCWPVQRAEQAPPTTDSLQQEKNMGGRRDQTSYPAQGKRKVMTSFITGSSFTEAKSHTGLLHRSGRNIQKHTKIQGRIHMTLVFTQYLLILEFSFNICLESLFNLCFSSIPRHRINRV